MRPEELSPSVTARVPVFVSRDDRYFQDRYQAMPRDGYTALFERLLDHPRISVELNVEYKDALSSVPHDRTVFTGPIDEFFDYVHGPLPYRSLRFERRVEPRAFGLPVGTVNYPNEFDFTRISDQRHLSGNLDAEPLLITEYPEAVHRRRQRALLSNPEPGDDGAARPIPLPAPRPSKGACSSPGGSAITPITTWTRRAPGRWHCSRSESRRPQQGSVPEIAARHAERSSDRAVSVTATPQMKLLSQTTSR